MKKRWLALAVFAHAALAGSAAAQTLGIGGRVGTLGLGGEVALGLTDRIVVRGGMGLTPIEPSTTVSDIDVTLSLPDWYNVGLDLYLNGVIRVGGGILFKSDDPSISGTFTTNQDIGGQTFTPQEIGTLTGVFDAADQVPYALIGFGKHTAPGFGLFLDLGVAFVGEPDIVLGAEGGTLSDQSGPLRTALDQEAADFEADVGSYLKFWPILSLGVRLGLG